MLQEEAGVLPVSEPTTPPLPRHYGSSKARSCSLALSEGASKSYKVSEASVFEIIKILSFNTIFILLLLRYKKKIKAAN